MSISNSFPLFFPSNSTEIFFIDIQVKNFNLLVLVFACKTKLFDLERKLICAWHDFTLRIIAKCQAHVWVMKIEKLAGCSRKFIDAYYNAHLHARVFNKFAHHASLIHISLLVPNENVSIVSVIFVDVKNSL